MSFANQKILSVINNIHVISVEITKVPSSPRPSHLPLTLYLSHMSPSCAVKTVCVRLGVSNIDGQCRVQTIPIGIIDKTLLVDQEVLQSGESYVRKQREGRRKKHSSFRFDNIRRLRRRIPRVTRR